MVTLMEDVDSESGSQNGLQRVNIEDLALETEETMVTLERPGIPGEAHNSRCLSYKQTTAGIKVFLSCFSNVFLN